MVVRAWHGGLAWITSNLREPLAVSSDSRASLDDEGERVVGVRLDVDADHVEAGAVVTHRTATGAREQVEETRADVHCSSPRAI
jgi:hypothetical protein